MISYLFVLASSCLFSVYTEAHIVELCVNICPPCLPEDVANCPKISNCAHVVKPSGCGRCCDVCALTEGERCGVSLSPCGPGLECRGSTEQGTLNAILLNQATCQSTSRKSQSRQVQSVKHQSSRRRHSRRPHRVHLSGLNFNGPCSRHLESVMASCATLPLVAWIPTCVRGFYKAKQCVTSGGHGHVGKCWCVDKLGRPVGNNSDTSENLKCPTS